MLNSLKSSAVAVKNAAVNLWHQGLQRGESEEARCARDPEGAAAETQEPEPPPPPLPPPPPPFGGIPLEVADINIFPNLSAHGVARLQCTGRKFYKHISDEHDCWNAIAPSEAGVGEDGGESAKMLCLKRLQKSCSFCGARGDIDLELENSRKYACSTCTFRFVDQCKLLATHDSRIRKEIINLDIAARRRLLTPVLNAPCLREILEAAPAPCPQLLFSTRVDGRAVGTLFASTEGYRNLILMVEAQVMDEWPATRPDDDVAVGTLVSVS
jgi:hypothetical protein